MLGASRHGAEPVGRGTPGFLKEPGLSLELGLGFWVLGLGFRVLGLGFRVLGLGFRV